MTASADYGFVGLFRPPLTGETPGVIAGANAYAAAIGRAYFPGRVNAFDLFGSPTSAPLRMLPVPWPSTMTADQWGISYPSDIWLLPTKLGRSGSGAYDARWAAYWKTNLEAETLEGYAVPKILPVGYTARRKRDWHWHGVGDGFSAHTGANGVSSNAYKIRTATGYTWTQWVPDALPYGYVGLGMSTATAPQSGGVRSHGGHERGIGYRNVQYRITRPLTGILWSGSLVVRLSHNADGSFGSSTADGGVIDYTHSHPPSDFTIVGSTAETAWFNAGPQLPTLGVASFFKNSLDYSGISGGSASGPLILSFRLSPRMDVPMPFTSTARGGVIAPGGVV